MSSCKIWHKQSCSVGPIDRDQDAAINIAMLGVCQLQSLPHPEELQRARTVQMVPETATTDDQRVISASCDHTPQVSISSLRHTDFGYTIKIWKSAQMEVSLEQFHDCCRRGNLEGLELQTKSDAVSRLVSTRGSLGNTALHYAAHAGHDDIMSLLLEHGAEINAQNDVHDTPLHQAVWRNHISSVLLLLRHNADASIRNANRQTPSDLAHSDDMKRALFGTAPLVSVVYADSDADSDE